MFLQEIGGKGTSVIRGLRRVPKGAGVGLEELELDCWDRVRSGNL